jgi:plastocyanin
VKNLQIRSQTFLVLIVSMGVAAVSLAIATGLLVPSPSGQAIAQPQSSNMTTTTQSVMPASSNKTFRIFSAEVEGLNEITAKIPGDIYSLPVIVVDRGDNVTVYNYNTEEVEVEAGAAAVERHSFTIDAQPYRVDIDVAPGESGNATFTADQEGIFPYYCKYHLPTMTGQLVVLPSSSPGESPPATT